MISITLFSSLLIPQKLGEMKDEEEDWKEESESGTALLSPEEASVLPACPVSCPSETSSWDPERKVGVGRAERLYLLLVQFMKPLSRFLFIQRDLFQRKSPVLLRRLKAKWITRWHQTEKGKNKSLCVRVTCQPCLFYSNLTLNF